ncbi:hypothetical protein FRACYDRAFT_227534 [Fragilariopsis cylindrus CCMP1102]|uniref:Rad4-domain-containing protein n=1 Tax=Fragilariopsis cylindrus CCMP1102 TaxID=635003 RepID=A0A1E7F3H9_9STRA|nr:hypothetical protein FRACYDRAFT_227534 [Fragilariopsis cylindrus CCMP1102]|eukprot:OEU12686.1 hypothetical protein FRACYDRAFT_227534 [Fragilariopsis cylindrus CCMP1102]
MSFEFNLSSDDDDDGSSDDEKGNFVSEQINKNTADYGAKITDKDHDDGSSAASDDSEEKDPNDDEDNDNYYDYDDDNDNDNGCNKPDSAMEDSSFAFPSDFDDPTSTATKTGGDIADNEEDDEIDWEDAGDEGYVTPRSFAPKAVTLDMGNKNTENDDGTKPNNEKNQNQATKRKRRIMSRSIFQHNKLNNPRLKHLLTSLNKSSLLSWTSHANSVSRYVSNDESLGLALSLIPSAWLNNNGDNDENNDNDTKASSSLVAVPTFDDVGHFIRWFANYVGCSSSSSSTTTAVAATAVFVTPTGKRTRAKKLVSSSSSSSSSSSASGNKQTNWNKYSKQEHSTSTTTVHYRLSNYCSYLASRNLQQNNNIAYNNKLSYNEYDKIILFLAMVRSMGWRARYVVAVEPIPRDLDVNHPLFHNETDGTNVLVNFWKRCSTSISSSSSIAATAGGDKSTPISNNGNNSTSASTNKHVCWVEILCRPSKRNTASSKMLWVHIDPIQGIINKPEIIEQMLYAKNRDLPLDQVLTAAAIGKKNRKNNRLPLSYALAVEHISSGKTKKWKNTRSSDNTNTDGNENNDDDLVVRMTDVTRRYASSMVETMEARGIPQQRTKSKSKRQRIISNMRGGRNTYNSIIEQDQEHHPDKWWSKFLKTISNPKHNHSLPPPRAKLPFALDSDSGGGGEDGDEDDDNHDNFDLLDRDEESQLAAKKEPLPTSKAGFKKHPQYVIRSVLNSTEVLVPDAKKRVCGMFKGELVFQRSDVDTALSEKRWLYEGRKVREPELDKPVLKVKARKKPASDGQFKALKSYGVGETNDGSAESRAKQIQDASKPLVLGDGKKHLYGSWQTDPWGPTPVGPNEKIPVNEYNNIELELLNPGLVHVELHRIAKVAKKLNLPYAPCLLGFESNGVRGGGGRKPTIRGIVIHEHNEELLREAHAGMSDYLLQQEYDDKKHSILSRWKRLLFGILTKDRLEREYGVDNDDDDNNED